MRVPLAVPPFGKPFGGQQCVKCGQWYPIANFYRPGKLRAQRCLACIEATGVGGVRRPRPVTTRAMTGAERQRYFGA